VATAIQTWFGSINPVSSVDCAAAAFARIVLARWVDELARPSDEERSNLLKPGTTSAQCGREPGKQT